MRVAASTKEWLPEFNPHADFIEGLGKILGSLLLALIAIPVYVLTWVYILPVLLAIGFAKLAAGPLASVFVVLRSVAGVAMRGIGHGAALLLGIALLAFRGGRAGRASYAPTARTEGGPAMPSRNPFAREPAFPTDDLEGLWKIVGRAQNQLVSSLLWSGLADVEAQAVAGKGWSAYLDSFVLEAQLKRELRLHTLTREKREELMASAKAQLEYVQTVLETVNVAVLARKKLEVEAARLDAEKAKYRHELSERRRPPALTRPPSPEERRDQRIKAKTVALDDEYQEHAAVSMRNAQLRVEKKQQIRAYFSKKKQQHKDDAEIMRDLEEEERRLLEDFETRTED